MQEAPADIHGLLASQLDVPELRSLTETSRAMHEMYQPYMQEMKKLYQEVQRKVHLLSFIASYYNTKTGKIHDLSLDESYFTSQDFKVVSLFYPDVIQEKILVDEYEDEEDNIYEYRLNIPYVEMLKELVFPSKVHVIYQKLGKKKDVQEHEELGMKYPSMYYSVKEKVMLEMTPVCLMDVLHATRFFRVSEMLWTYDREPIFELAKFGKEKIVLRLQTNAFEPGD